MSLSLSREGFFEDYSSQTISQHRPRISAPVISHNDIHLVADQYRQGKESPLQDRDGFQRWIADLFQRLPYRVQLVEHDPYRSLDSMRAEVYSTNRLLITTKNNDSIFDPEVNLMFRAVHDADHIAHGCRFDAGGELTAGRVFTNRCGDEWGRALLFSEIVAQACTAVAFGNFSRQKFVRFPRRFREEVLRHG